MDVRAQIEERGWALFPSVIDEARCRAFLLELEAIWETSGRPQLYSRQDRAAADSVLVSPVGMAAHGLLARLPGARELLLPPRVVAAAEAALGAGFRLENAAGILSDETRPFFFWHHHLAGLVDAQDYLTLENRYPVYTRIERLSCTFYPVPLDEDHGVMLVHPRSLAQPSEPPFADTGVPWPGQAVVQCPAGSVLLMDQSVWHAVTPMRRPGRRAFLAGFLVPADLRP